MIDKLLKGYSIKKCNKYFINVVSSVYFGDSFANDKDLKEVINLKVKIPGENTVCH